MRNRHAPEGASARKGQTDEQRALRHAVQDTWEQLEGKRAHTAGRLLGRLVRQLPPLYMGERNDHKLLKPGEILHEGERILDLRTMATGVFKGERGGKKLPAICGKSTADEYAEAFKRAGLVSCRRVRTRLGLMAAYSFNAPAILAQNPSDLLAELDGIAAVWKARRASRSGPEVSPENGLRYPRNTGEGIPVFRGTNSHTQVTPLANNNPGASRMDGPSASIGGSAPPMVEGPSAPFASLTSPNGRPTPDAASPPPEHFPQRSTAKPKKLLDMEHSWRRSRERAGFKATDWTERDFGAAKQMQKWWPSEFGPFDSFIAAVPGMWSAILPAFDFMTKNPPPKAPCIRFVWANIDAFAQAYQETPAAFVARIKAPLSKEEKREIADLTKGGVDRKAATREVFKRRWPEAQGLGMIRVRQSQRRVRREEQARADEANRQAQLEHEQALAAIHAVGQIALALAPRSKPEPEPPAAIAVQPPAVRPSAGITRRSGQSAAEIGAMEARALASVPNPRRHSPDVYDRRTDHAA